MKKKLIIIGVALVGLIGVGVYFLLPLLSSKDLSRYVPKNAVFVLKTDIAQMGGKIDFKEIAELKFFRKEVMENMKSSQKDMVEKTMKNPINSGIQFRTAPTFFVFEHSEDEPVAVFMFGVSDAKKFNTFISDMSNDISVKEPSSDKFYEASVDGDNNMSIYFNNNIAMVLVDLDRKDISLKRVRDKIVDVSKENSILSNEAYSKFNAQKNDVMAFLNTKELGKILKNQGMGGQGQIDPEDLSSMLPTAMALNFNEDAVSLKSFYSEKAGKTNVLKEGGLTEGELKNIAARGNPFAFMTVNLDPAKLIDAAVELSEMTDPNAKDEFFGSVDELASTLNTDRESMFKLFAGKMSVAFSGIIEQSKFDPFILEETKNKAPRFYFWAKLGNRSLAESILDKIVEGGGATESEGVYAFNEENVYDPTLYIAIKGENLFVSTDLSGIKGKVNNDNWETLTEGGGKQLALSKPIAAFVDLNYKNYQDLVESSVGPSESELFDKLNKKVFSSFKNITLSSTDKEAEMLLQLSEQKKNSLQRLIVMIDEAYRITN